MSFDIVGSWPEDFDSNESWCEGVAPAAPAPAGTVYTTAGGRRFHADRECQALSFGRFTQAVWAGEDWMDGLYPIRRRDSIDAARAGFTACRVCVPPALALPATGQTYGHEPFDQYAGTPEGDRGLSNAVCARCIAWQWHPALRLGLGFPVRWPCTSAVVLGLAPRPVAHLAAPIHQPAT